MKRSFSVASAALLLLVPTLTFAQIKTVYIPGAHPRVVVLPPDNATPPERVDTPALAPAEVIARHEPMAAMRRVSPRVDYAAVAHCDRLVADARATLRKNF